MSPDPVVLDIHERSVPHSCADVLRTAALTVHVGKAYAALLFRSLPGLAMVAVSLPGGHVAFLTRRGHLCTEAWRPMLTEYVYAWWLASCVRTTSASGDSSDL
jgi:hypothetical protein